MQNTTIFYRLLSKCSRTLSTPVQCSSQCARTLPFLALSAVQFYFPTCWNSMKMILKVSLNLALVYFDRFQQTLDKTTLFYIAKNNQCPLVKQKKKVLYQKYKRKLKRINIVVCFFPREIWLLQMDQIHNVTHWSLTGVTNYWSFSFFSLFKWNPFNARIKRFNSHEKWTYYLLFCYFFLCGQI